VALISKARREFLANGLTGAFTLVFLTFIAGLALAAPAKADSPTSTLIVGIQAGRYFVYPFGTYKMPLKGTLKNGWIAQFGSNNLFYKFQLSSNKTISAWAPSAEALGGYAVSGGAGNVSLVFGPQWRDTVFSDNFTSSLTAKFGVKGELSGTGNFGDTVHLSETLSYATVNQFYRVQNRLLFGQSGGIQFGPEATFLGNPQFIRQQYGVAVTSIPLSSRVTMTVNGGYQHHQSVASGLVEEGSYFGALGAFTLGGN
jgi:hypothetical protein